MIRIAAAGDVHFDSHSQGKLKNYLQDIKSKADVFLLAGDLTQTGKLEEARALASDLEGCPIPVIAVLGNHDYHADQEDQITKSLIDVGVTVLDRTHLVIHVGGFTIGIAGVKGFCGGFLGACGSEFGEREMKNFIHTTRMDADALRESLQSLKTDYKIALLHYSPIPETLLGEKKEIYPFLGSYLLAEAIDEGKADMVFHGHAHKGTEKGATASGVPVRNVAQPVIRHAFNIYYLNKDELKPSPLPPTPRVSNMPHAFLD